MTPFLIRTLGMHQFGNLEFAKAISFYFTTFVNYGFRYSATKQISLYKQDKSAVGKIISSVYALQLIILLFCFMVMMLLITFCPTIQAEYIYLLCFFLVVIASTLCPTFAFQGLHHTHWLTVINLFAKLILLVSVFAFIRNPSDAFLFPLLLAAIDMVRLLAALYLLYVKLEIPLCFPVSAIMRQQVKEGLHIFLTEIATLFYTRCPTLFLKFTGGSTMVTLYVLGSKVASITESLIEPFMQALYPIVYKKLTTNYQTGIQYIKHLAKNSLVILGGLGIMFCFFAERIIVLLAGQPLLEASSVLKICAFWPILIFLIKLLGIGVLIPLQAGKKYTLSILLTGFITVGLHIILVPRYQADGAAFSIVLSDFVAVMLTYYFAYRTVKSAAL
eukprot:gene214-282_t